MPGEMSTGACFSTVSLALTCFAFAGCAASRQDAVPLPLATAAPVIDLANGNEYKPIPPSVLRRLEEKDTTTARMGEAPRQIQVLALSGGGKYGAYSAGLLNGWSRSGKRPTFDVVTGVSTGALIASFAFVGPKYDRRLEELYTTLTTRDVIRRRPLFGVANDAVYSSEPLAALIEREVTECFLGEVRAAHVAGRRLFVGTTNIDTSRAVIWDMGAIAASRRPDRLHHFRQVLLASASVPGALPPVRIPVTYNGCGYVELHGDGGAAQELFLRGTMLGIDPDQVRPGRKPLEGSDLYVVLAGKLYADGYLVEPNTFKLGAAAASSVLYAQTRSDLARLYTLASMTGMRYHQASLSPDVPTTGGSLEFDPAEMRRLFDAGYCDGLRHRWRSTPPETEESEQLVPRKGTDFYTPIVTYPGR